jgi:hypothetical protein
MTSLIVYIDCISLWELEKKGAYAVHIGLSQRILLCICSSNWIIFYVKIVLNLERTIINCI